MVWTASNLGIDRIFFLSLCNTFLAGLFIKIFDSFKVNILVTSSFIITNFYLYVLFFTGERLKFGFIFFLLAFLYRKKLPLSLLFLILSIFSHLQMLILCLGRALQLVLNELQPLEFRRSLLLALPALGVGFFVIQTTLFGKILAYGDDRTLFDFLRMGVFFLIALYYTKDKMETVIYFSTLFMAVYLVGGDRVNMIGYMFCLYYCLPYRGGFNLGMLITSLYFYMQILILFQKLFYMGMGFHP